MKDSNSALKALAFIVGVAMIYPAVLFRIALVQWAWVVFCAEWTGISGLPRLPLYGLMFILQVTLHGLGYVKPDEHKTEFEKDAPTLFASINSLAFTALAWAIGWIFLKLL